MQASTRRRATSGRATRRPSTSMGRDLSTSVADGPSRSIGSTMSPTSGDDAFSSVSPFASPGTILCVGERVTVGDAAGTNCLCSRHCHSCHIARNGRSTCVRCKNSRYLHGGRCHADCHLFPDHPVEVGSGKFSRVCASVAPPTTSTLLDGSDAGAATPAVRSTTAHSRTSSSMPAPTTTMRKNATGASPRVPTSNGTTVPPSTIPDEKNATMPHEVPPIVCQNQVVVAEEGRTCACGEHCHTCLIHGLEGRTTCTRCNCGSASEPFCHPQRVIKRHTCLFGCGTSRDGQLRCRIHALMS